MCEFEFSVREYGHETVYSENINIRISRDPDEDGGYTNVHLTDQDTNEHYQFDDDDENINDFMDSVIYGSDNEWEW